LEGEAILIRHIPKLDTPSKYFSSGNIAQNSSEATKDHHPPNTSFSVWGGPFPPLIETENVLAPLILSSLKTLEDHLLWSREFAQMVGNISITFWLAIIEKDAIKKVL
jgi:uncharacterized protein (UPF0303 family)